MNLIHIAYFLKLVSDATQLNCEFETDFCLWKNMIIDDFNWDRRQGMSCTPDTGPIFDHTFANVSGRVTSKVILK